MTHTINIANMREDLKKAQGTAISTAKQLRGITATATAPETYENNILAAHWYIGQAIAFKMISDRYQYQDTAYGFDTWRDITTIATSAQRQADAAKDLLMPNETETLSGIAEAYEMTAKEIWNGRWEEDNQ